MSSLSTTWERNPVRHAMRFARTQLGGLHRSSGETFADHSLEVAHTLREKIRNPSLVAAAVLHTIPHFLEKALHRGECPFDDRAYHDLSPACDERFTVPRPQTHALGDPRLTLLHAAHVLNDVRHLDRLEVDVRVPFCRSVLSDFAPFVRKLQFHDWACEMEHTCFLATEPSAASTLQRLCEPTRQEDIVLLKTMSKTLRRAMRPMHFRCAMEYRIKSLYSTYVKMSTLGCTPHALQDRLALRVFCANDDECYRMLHCVHGAFAPVPASFKDYIAEPKANGYRSLHTVVHAPLSFGGVPVEVQIRSNAMHWNCLYGSADHLHYKKQRYHTFFSFSRDRSDTANF